MDHDQESHSTNAAIDDPVKGSETIAEEQLSSRDINVTVAHPARDSETMSGVQDSDLTPQGVETAVGDPAMVYQDNSEQQEPYFPQQDIKAITVEHVRELGTVPDKHMPELSPQHIGAIDTKPVESSEAVSGEQKLQESNLAPQGMNAATTSFVNSSKISSGEHESDLPLTPPTLKLDSSVQIENRNLPLGEPESIVTPTLQSLGQPPVQHENGNLCSPGGIASSEGLEVLRTSGPLLLEGLCEGCASILQSRLFGLLASGAPHNAGPHADANVAVVAEEPRPQHVESLDDRVDGTPGVAAYEVKLESRAWSEEQSSTSEGEEEYSAPRVESGDQRQEVLALATPAREIYVSRSTGDEEDSQTPHHEAHVQNSNGGETPRSNELEMHTPNGVDAARFTNDDFPALTPSPMAQSQSAKKKPPLEERMAIRMQTIEQKKDFICLERIHGRLVNTVQGLELHKGVFTKPEQDRLIKMVEEFQELGRQGHLRPRTFSEPRKWMPGKGRVTIQFGCCYNYATDSQNNPPGILREEQVDPLPKLLKSTIRRLIEWRVLPETATPDSCIINIYDVRDCIPPHIDHHDFVRPFCTLSLLSECSILFGSKLKIVGDGLFDGPFSIPLPVGSVLVLNGNGADVAKHAVPGVPTKRISITFRKMDPSKVPRGYELPPELRNVKGLAL